MSILLGEVVLQKNIRAPEAVPAAQPGSILKCDFSDCVTSYFWQTRPFILNGKVCRGVREPPGRKAAGVEQFGDDVLGISICQT